MLFFRLNKKLSWSQILTLSTLFFLLTLNLSCPALADDGAKQKNAWQTQELVLDDSEKRYEIKCHFPKFSESMGDNIEILNERIEKIIKERVNEHKNKFSKRETDGKNPSTLNISYSVHRPFEKLVSIVFRVDSYSAGAAHPNHWSQTLNFDLTKARFLKLSNVLSNDSNYLVYISKLCLESLKKKEALDEAWIKTGTSPKAINFLSYYLEKDGLTILFDEYKVGPYSAGPQKVDIPYTKIKNLVNPDLGIIK